MAQADRNLSFLLFGDLVVRGSLRQQVRQHGGDWLVAPVQSLLDGVDFSLAFVEAPIEDAALLPGPERLRWLVTAGPGCAEAGEDGITALLTAINQSGGHLVGCGANRQTAEAPIIQKIRGRKVAVLAAAEDPGLSAGHRRPGIARLQVRRLCQQVRQAAQAADMVIICLGGDVVGSAWPSPWRRKISRHFLLAGAHIVLWRGSGCVQGVEKVAGGLVIYGLGSLAQPPEQPAVDGGHALALMVTTRFAENGSVGCDMRLEPLRRGVDGRAIRAEPELVRSRRQRIDRLSRLQGALLARRWRKTARRYWRQRLFGSLEQGETRWQRLASMLAKASARRALWIALLGSRTSMN